MRNRMAIAVVIAVVVSCSSFGEGRAAFLPGDFITFTKASWGDPFQQGGITLLAHGKLSLESIDYERTMKSSNQDGPKRTSDGLA
jgi:hypothetical protein